MSETIDEFDLVKTKLVSHPRYKDLEIEHWEVEQAQPASDIIWTQMNKGKTRSFPVRFLLFFLPAILSVLSMTIAIRVDQSFKQQQNFEALSVFNKYLISFGLCLFNFALLPYIIFKVVQIERNELKSTKEQSFVTKNIILMILNSLVIPYVIFSIFTFSADDLHVNEDVRETPKIPKNVITQSDPDFADPNANTQPQTNNQQTLYFLSLISSLDNDINEFMARSISSSHEFFLRFIMQLVLIAVLWQIIMSPRRVIKSFHQMVAAGQKYKFRVSPTNKR